MKNTISTFIFLFTLFSSSLTSAQGGRKQSPPPIPDEAQVEIMIDQLTTELALSQEQEEQIASLYYAHFEEISNMMSSERGKDPIMRDEMEKQRTAFENEVKSLLTSKQKKQFNRFQKENEAQRSNQQRPPH